VLSYIDYYGTRVSAFDIHRPHRHLAVTATTTVETFPPTESWPGAVPQGSNGYAPTSTPMIWAELAASDADDRFEEFLTPTPLTGLDDELNGIAAEIKEASGNPSDAARTVCDWVHKKLTYEAGATDFFVEGVGSVVGSSVASGCGGSGALAPVVWK